MSNEGDDDQPILNEWRQGDLVLMPVEIPLLDIEAAEMVVGFAQAEHGIALITQSCDIVRTGEDKQYVQVAALLEVSEQELARSVASHLPSRISFPFLAALRLVVDLDTTATVHKEAVALWPRTASGLGDEGQRQFATALARHRQRFAFPDAFNDLVKPLRRWFEKKDAKDSSAGRLVRTVREVRVEVDAWEAPTRLVFLLLADEEAGAEANEWRRLLDEQETKLNGPGFPPAEFRLTTFSNISASEYLNSSRLDWDGLSDA